MLSIFNILTFSVRFKGEINVGKSLQTRLSKETGFIYKLVKNLYISNLLVIISIFSFGTILATISSSSSNCFSKVSTSLAIITQ